MGLGFAEAEGDGLGRPVVEMGQIQGIMERRDSGHFGGHVGLGKTRDNTILSRV